MQLPPATLSLRDLRTDRGDSGLALAQAIGVDNGLLSRIERGLSGAAPWFLAEIAAHYALTDAETVALLRWAAETRPRRSRGSAP